MKSIAIIVSRLNGGGAERTASNLSIMLSENYDVHLILFDGTNIKYPYNGMLHDLKLPHSSNKIINLWKRVKEVKKIKKQYKICSSISLMDGPNLVNVLSKVNDKIITSVRIRMSSSGNGNLFKFIRKINMKFVANKSYKVIALSKGVERDLHDNFGIPYEKMDVIYNPCDGKLLAELAKKNSAYERDNSCFLITTMGRLTEQKGQWHLLRALKIVVQELPNVKLEILGEGPLLEKLKGLTSELQLDNNVSFCGFIKSPHEHIADSDVFVFPSLFEGLGNVLLEALACGVPCISADCPSGPREILADSADVVEKMDSFEFAKYGILTSLCDEGHFDTSPITIEEKQMADAILAVLKDKKIQDTYKNLSLKRSESFYPEVIQEKWVKVLEDE